MRAQADVGDVQILGRTRDGMARDALVFQQDAPGTAGLEIDANVSIGGVEIRHA